MIRILFFLILLAAIALGAAWIADQGGGITLAWHGWQIETSVAVFTFGIVAIVAAALLLWSVFRGLWKIPTRLRRRHHEKREAKGRHAITHGLIAIGTGDSFAARRHASTAKRLAGHDPLALLLHAQTAQLEGDRVGAQRAFHAMAERADTRLLGLRGLFVEAQRSDDPYTAVAMAEAALQIAPGSPWASHAVLGFRCAKGDWDGALSILETNNASGLTDPQVYRRQRGVLLTARALEFEHRDRDLSRKSIMEAVKFAPTLVPAATLAAKFYSEDNQVRRAMRVLEVAWNANPHPDLAGAYAHVRLGDSARERLARIEMLAQKQPDHVEGRLAVARSALEAAEFGRTRSALAPLIEAPTQRVAMLMAELERAENNDEGRAREWVVRALRAALDPVWTADGYVSDRWRPVSPVTGRLDAFQWVTPVASLSSDRPVVDADPAIRVLPLSAQPDEKPAVPDEAPPSSAPTITEFLPAPNVPPPIFRPRPAGEKRDASTAPAVIALVRAPDDPGVPDENIADDLEDGSTRQPGGWKGFLSRLGG